VARHDVDEDQAREFLIARFGPVNALRALSGGFWSSAYAFVQDGRELVVRFGTNADRFEADRSAMAFSSVDLPVPDVLEIGDACGGVYAISVLHHGTRLESIRPDQGAVAGPMLASLIGALYRVPKSADLAVVWHERPVRADLTWRDWLMERLEDHPSPDVHLPQAALSVHPESQRVFDAAYRRVREIVDVCPERRDLVHGDLLNANVLVTDDASRPSAVFSWKCSVRGDFLFDVAWCTFWSHWHPGIAAADPWRHTRRDATLRNDDEAWAEASLRHHCYELHIGATHLGFNAWTGDVDWMERIAARIEAVLARGPLALSS
jgi:aminoglycoside phosphotransferase (APT) family kinase protein